MQVVALVPSAGPVPPPNIVVTPEESAAQMQKLIDKLDIASTGRFLAWNGKELAW